MLDQSWLAWVKENIGRGCDPQDILGILLKNNFPLPDIRDAMGQHFPAYSALLPQVAAGVDHKALYEKPVVQLQRDPTFRRIDTPKLQLFTLENFLSEKECDALIAIINHNLRPSTVTVYAEGFRTSQTCDLVHMNHAIILGLDQKISSALGIQLPYSEGSQALKYQPGQEFKPHTDYFEPGTDEYAQFGGARGNRTWTFMVYLNDTPAGGGTQFVNIDKTFTPKTGRCVIWNNLYADGRVNPDTLHWGMPVESGEKIIITKWFREKGTGAMFYGDM